MANDTGRTVRRRRVFYIPGYDPFHPRRYRELYRREGAEQARISGYRIDQQAGNGDRFGWDVTAEIDGAQTETTVEVLVWSDIVKSSMSASIPQTYLMLLRTVWIYVGSGALWRLFKTRKGPVIAALYPVVALLLQLLVAVGIGWVAGAGAAWLHPYARWPAVVAVVILILRWFRSVDSRLFAYYLMLDYAFTARLKGANPPALDARLEVFRDVIGSALRSDADEVLVIGHSSGAHIGVNLLAGLLRQGDVPDDGPALSFLTLGQVVPMVSFLPSAGALRRDLCEMSAQDRIPWVDVTAPGDGCAFALCDPVSVSGVAPANKRWPLVFSAAFTQTLSPALWKSLRWRFFRLHFQYLCAFDCPRDYDYFQITAGPKTLGARYAGRPASRSRIETVLSGYTDMAP